MIKSGRLINSDDHFYFGDIFVFLSVQNHFLKPLTTPKWSKSFLNGVCEPDGTHEIDIEFAKWGNATQTNTLNYTTYPNAVGGATYHQTFPLSLSGTYTTHRYTRSTSYVYFQSLYGHQTDNTNQFASATSTNIVSTLVMPVYMNLWLFQGRLPSDKKEVEIIIRDFKFVAQ